MWFICHTLKESAKCCSDLPKSERPLTVSGSPFLLPDVFITLKREYILSPTLLWQTFHIPYVIEVVRLCLDCLRKLKIAAAVLIRTNFRLVSSPEKL